MRLPCHYFLPVADKDPARRKAAAGIAYADRKTGPEHMGPCRPVHFAADSQERVAEAAGMELVDTAEAGIVAVQLLAPAAGIGAARALAAAAVVQAEKHFD